MYITCISIPISAICCLTRPRDENAMKYHVVSPKYLENNKHVDSKRFYIKITAFQVVLTSIMLVSL